MQILVHLNDISTIFTLSKSFKEIFCFCSSVVDPGSSPQHWYTLYSIYRVIPLAPQHCSTVYNEITINYTYEFFLVNDPKCFCFEEDMMIHNNATFFCSFHYVAFIVYAFILFYTIDIKTKKYNILILISNLSFIYWMVSVDFELHYFFIKSNSYKI